MPILDKILEFWPEVPIYPALNSKILQGWGSVQIPDKKGGEKWRLLSAIPDGSLRKQIKYFDLNQFLPFSTCPTTHTLTIIRSGLYFFGDIDDSRAKYPLSHQGNEKQGI